MQIGLASKRTWCETEVAEKFTCPAAWVERVWASTDACLSCVQEPGGQAAVSSYSPLTLMWLFIVMGNEPRGLHMLNNFYQRLIPDLQLFYKGNILLSTAPYVFKNLLFPTFILNPLICLWSLYFDHLLDRMSFAPYYQTVCRWACLSMPWALLLNRVRNLENIHNYLK